MAAITNEDELDTAQNEMGRLLDKGECGRSRDDDERLEVLAGLIRAYEDVHWALPQPKCDPA
jgi:antitoxin component HigA of HigAB toxin-antitoxin module